MTEPKPFSARARARSFGHAWRGIIQAVKTQHNMWLQLLITAGAIVLGILLHLNRGDWLWLIAAIGMVIGAELVNTAIESLCDVVSSAPHPGIAKAKDIAAGAVLVAALAAGAIGVLVFWPHLWVG